MSRLGAYQWMTGKVFLPLFDAFLDRGILKAYEECKEWQWLTPEEVRSRQWCRLSELLVYASERVPFYRDRFAQASIAARDIRSSGDLLALPVLTKSDLVQHNQDLISVDYARRKLKRWSTGGSTGETVIFYVDRRVAGSRKAREMRFHDWMGVRAGDRIAKIWGSPIEVAEYRRWWKRMEYRAKNYLFLPGHLLTEAQMGEYVNALRRFRPKVIIGFTPALFVFSRFLDQNRIDDIRPQAVITTSATLFSTHRELHERVFGCQVFDTYGSREGGGMAYECEAHSGALHVAAESVFIEIVKDGRHVAAGEIGEILLTDLSNRAAPLIRYQIKDTAAWVGQPCPCGRGLPLLKIASGRVSDLLVTPSGGLVLGEFFIDVFDEISQYVMQFQVVQPFRDLLRIKVVPRPGYSQKIEAFVRRAVASKFGSEVRVEVEEIDSIPPAPSGKYVFTRCEVPLDFVNASQLPESNV